jgi:polyhydroxyalkanoate synthesis repressor PhaR
VSGSVRERAAEFVPHVEPRLRVVGAPVRVVKRYGNRKLYDTAASRYVKLDEIADLIRNGVEIKVVEHPSGRDITSAALAHIIFEEEASRSQRSAEVLAEVIRGATAPSFPRPAPVRPTESDDVIDRAVRRFDQALNQGHRARAGVGAILGSTFATLERLRATASERVDLAHDICGGLSRARRDLERIARRLDTLHDRLSSLES